MENTTFLCCFWWTTESDKLLATLAVKEDLERAVSQTLTSPSAFKDICYYDGTLGALKGFATKPKAA